MELSELKSDLNSRLNLNEISLKRIGGGNNSRVYRLMSEGPSDYLVKVYYKDRNDPRDRLGTELGAFAFLWNNGVKNIPRLFWADQKLGYAIFEYCHGEKVLSTDVSREDMDTAIDFLINLKDLRAADESKSLPEASEACFSIQGVINNIETRLDRLFLLGASQYHDSSLERFLKKDFMPQFEAIKKWCRSRAGSWSVAFAEELPLKGRTLSPSDFGFHNALRLSDDRLVFFDFEYFGWDDPAKMILDFVLHPGMDLPFDLKCYFVTKILEKFESHDLASRLNILYPLFGLKWCMILLNEFVPSELGRRNYACPNSRNNKRQLSQLNKSKQMLLNIISTYNRFPYTN